MYIETFLFPMNDRGDFEVGVSWSFSRPRNSARLSPFPGCAAAARTYMKQQPAASEQSGARIADYVASFHQICAGVRSYVQGLISPHSACCFRAFGRNSASSDMKKSSARMCMSNRANKILPHHRFVRALGAPLWQVHGVVDLAFSSTKSSPTIGMYDLHPPMCSMVFSALAGQKKNRGSGDSPQSKDAVPGDGHRAN